MVAKGVSGEEVRMNYVELMKNPEKFNEVRKKERYKKLLELRR